MDRYRNSSGFLVLCSFFVSVSDWWGSSLELRRQLEVVVRTVVPVVDMLQRG